MIYTATFGNEYYRNHCCHTPYFRVVHTIGDRFLLYSQKSFGAKTQTTGTTNGIRRFKNVVFDAHLNCNLVAYTSTYRCVLNSLADNNGRNAPPNACSRYGF